MSSTPQSEAPVILLVEDEYFVAEEMVQAFSQEGTTVVGPVAALDEALAIARSLADLDGAVLDLNLCGEMAYPIADVLGERRIPFVFATGYGMHSILDAYKHVPLYEKPVQPKAILNTLLKH